ncbi:MAG: molybdopterin-dependent oxidoreductase [Paracoccaceae bacterium]
MAEVTAESLPAPTGEVILTVRGDIALTNGDAEAALDRVLLESIGVRTIHTGTIWTEGTSEFQGVELSRLLLRLGADGSTLRLSALNDYAVDIPMSEAVDNGPLLAFRMDGKNLSPRDKGPLWMIYPYDLNPAYKNEVSYSRSIWQLTVIEVLP